MGAGSRWHRAERGGGAGAWALEGVCGGGPLKSRWVESVSQTGEEKAGCGARVWTLLQGLPGSWGRGGVSRRREIVVPPQGGSGGPVAPCFRVGSSQGHQVGQNVVFRPCVAVPVAPGASGPLTPLGAVAETELLLYCKLAAVLRAAGGRNDCLTTELLLSLSDPWARPTVAALPWGSGAPAPSILEQSGTLFAAARSRCFLALYPRGAVASSASPWPRVALVSAGSCGAEAMSAVVAGCGLRGAGGPSAGGGGGSWPMGVWEGEPGAVKV